ncbi:MAG: MmcQ/YjbR family DNA-binding protein [Oscillospiraceae bacterium]|jgi:predicted DNA-binding protein (MmcQ/YjbR family)|nr:MmcQ/YjbR family DNA-binding protein [Oscillospiraceae bacterium]
MTKQELIDSCAVLPDVDEIYTSGQWTVARHSENKKGFAFIFEREGKLCVNLKCDPSEADLLRQSFDGVLPGYSMSKTHWNTVMVDSDVPEDELCRRIQASYDLIKPKVRRVKI